MAHLLRFSTKYLYSAAATGITLPVLLRLASRSVLLPAKLDSGSDLCVFQRDYAEVLGVRVEDGERLPVSTVTGSFVTFGHDLSLEVCGLSFECRVCFYEERHFRRNVLGRTWLQKCRVAIVEHDSTVFLSHYND